MELHLSELVGGQTVHIIDFIQVHIIGTHQLSPLPTAFI